ncbi:hypothetical protein LJB89_02820 [Tyzzerella sp. OttesenSCG-928-J15]|nr:hypothetical protein [Tyzzerella sp. OttesenSCG-928-J15]
MAVETTNYQCPGCTGPLHFEGSSGKLECEYCGTAYDLAIIEQLYADKEQAAAAEPEWNVTAAGSSWSDEEAAHIKAFICPSCSAELVCDDTTAATSCPYCGNPTVVAGRFSGMLKPDYVIPFKLDKLAAIAALKNYYKGKKFLPGAFASANHIEEIKGIYVPFWLFDGESDANMRFRGTIVHKHTHADEEITTTEHFRVTRRGNIVFEKIPVDGSSKMPDAHMDAVEPFDYSALVPFSPAYLPGYMADKYDEDAGACVVRANERIKTSTEQAFADTAKGYTTLVPEYTDIRLKQATVKYALMPVWMLSTKWAGQDFLFAMNGQTGKLIGDLPVDWRKFFIWFAGISAPLMAILGFILFYGGGII